MGVLVLFDATEAELRFHNFYRVSSHCGAWDRRFGQKYGLVLRDADRASRSAIAPTPIVARNPGDDEWDRRPGRSLLYDVCQPTRPWLISISVCGPSCFWLRLPN